VSLKWMNIVWMKENFWMREGCVPFNLPTKRVAESYQSQATLTFRSNEYLREGGSTTSTIMASKQLFG
jgi:hypothetical protein